MPSPVRLISLATAVPPFVLGQKEVMAEASALFRDRSEEIARRLTELDGGAVQTVAWPEARRRILESPDGTIPS